MLYPIELDASDILTHLSPPLCLLHVSTSTQHPYGWLQYIHTIFILGEIVSLGEFLYSLMAKCGNNATQQVSHPLVCSQKPYSQIYCLSMVIYSTQMSQSSYSSFLQKTVLYLSLSDLSHTVLQFVTCFKFFQNVKYSNTMKVKFVFLL